MKLRRKMEKFDMSDITPAMITKAVDTEDQLSPQEFQTILYYWFNQKGLVSNMRSYLRVKMISLMKSTTIGKSMNSNTNISLENQVLNILIADYLFQHHYDYSLSVFSTEVPIKNLVSEFCFFVFNKEKSKTRHKLDSNNVMCVVETLGINANSDLATEILTNYNKMEHGSLLICILKMVMNYYKPERPTDDGTVEDIGKAIRTLTLHLDLPSALINHLIEKMNIIVKSQVNHAISKITKNYEQEKLVLQEAYNNKESDFKHKLMDMDKFLHDETNKIQNEHKKLVYLTENLIRNEKKLSDKSTELENKLKKVNELEIRLAEEIKKTANSKIVHEPCKLKHCNGKCEELQKELEELRIQKNGFERIAENQNILIANLTTKSNIIYEQLQEGLITIQDLRSQLNAKTKLLEIEMRKKEEASEKTLSSSEALSVLVDREADDNIEEAIKHSRLKLEQLEKESAALEREFRPFHLSQQH